MSDDWDLFAVVRSCTNSTATAAATPPPPITTSSSISSPARVSRNREDPFVNSQFYFPGVIDERDDYSFQGLEEIYKELYLDSAAASAVPAPSEEFQNTQQQQQVQQRVLQPPPPPQQQNQHSPINRRGIIGSSFPSHSAARPRRRKNQQAKVTHHMTQEELSTDSWAWRKYGQKPIKGSPYPRNYYRCSTSKSCSARKQVERSLTDPDIFVVSYSGEHTHPRPTHRSSLAGSKRSKLQTTKPPTNVPATLITTSSSSPVSASSFSSIATPIVMEEEEEEEEGDSEGNQENINRGDNDNHNNNNNNIEDDEEDDEEEEEEEDEDILIPNSFITDDILKGFEELNGGGSGTNIGGSDSVADNSSAYSLISPPWTPTTNFAAAGGGC